MENGPPKWLPDKWTLFMGFGRLSMANWGEIGQKLKRSISLFFTKCDEDVFWQTGAEMSSVRKLGCIVSLLPWEHNSRVSSRIHLWRWDPGLPWRIAGVLKSTGLCSWNADTFLSQHLWLIEKDQFSVAHNLQQVKLAVRGSFIVTQEKHWHLRLDW